MNFYFFIKKWRWIFSICCISLFVLMENPSIYTKFQHTNFQLFSISKSSTLILAEIILFLCILFSARSFAWFKFLICACLTLSTIIFDTYFYASGKVIEFQEFLLLYQSKANLFDALLMYKIQILKAFPRVLILWIGVYLMPPPPPRYIDKINFFSCCVSALFFLSLTILVLVTCVYRQGAATNKLPAPISLYGLLLAYCYDGYKNPHQYKYIQKDIVPTYRSEYQNIILIIDESVRWDYSPFLRIKDYKKWFVYDYGRATSYANSSAVSNILLRKGARFESLSSDFYENPLIWDYAKKAGYQTYLYDNQGGGVGHDYFDKEEMKLVDHNISTSVYKDSEIWKSLKYLNENQKTFTLIIKKGSHFPYRDFPEEQNISFEMTSYQKATEMRVKYLKSIIFQSDDFWRDFFNLNITKSTLIIYTSDHGQNLGDIKGLTHGTSGKNPYFGEGLVPMVLLSNITDKRIEEYFKKNINNTSHFNIFPTLIESMGYDVKNLGYLQKNTSLRDHDVPISGFFYGIPFGYFGKKADFYILNKI